MNSTGPSRLKSFLRTLAHNGTARRRFEREARAAAAIVHPNVIPIHSVNTSKGHPFIVMPLVSGRSLQAHIEQKGPMETKDVVRVGMQIAAGLAAAHQQGLIHRDIKPANILIEQDVSRVVITDFGFARAADDMAMTQTGWLAGTPHYMSPEQASGNSIDPRSDLFSLGAVMYFLATGREPFRAEKPVAVLHKIVNEPAIPANQINCDIPQTLSDIIEKLLEKQAHDRFVSAARAQKVLEEYLACLQQPQHRRSTVRVVTRRMRKQRQRLAVLLIALTMIPVGFWAGRSIGFGAVPIVSSPKSDDALKTTAGSDSFSASAEESNRFAFSINDDSPSTDSFVKHIETRVALMRKRYSGIISYDFEHELQSLWSQIHQMEDRLQPNSAWDDLIPFDANTHETKLAPSESIKTGRMEIDLQGGAAKPSIDPCPTDCDSDSDE